jgi:hypothetical protein
MASRGSESDAGEAARLLKVCEFLGESEACLRLGLLEAARGERVRSRCLRRFSCLSRRGVGDRDREVDPEYGLCVLCLSSLRCGLLDRLSSLWSLSLRLRLSSYNDLDCLRFRVDRSSPSLSRVLLCRGASLLLSRCRCDLTSLELSCFRSRRFFLSRSSSSLYSCRLRTSSSLSTGVSRPSTFLCVLSSSLLLALACSRSIILSRARDSSASFARSDAL